MQTGNGGKQGTPRRQLCALLEKDGAISQRQLMQIILANAYPSRDLSALAEEICLRFPSVQAALCADYAELMTVEGMTRRMALYLKALGCAYERVGKKITHISDPQAFIKYISELMRNYDSEHAELFIIDKSGDVIGEYTYTSGRINRIDVDLYDMLSKMPTGGAYGIYLAHNHVNCSATPSHSDDIFTVRLYKACKTLGLKFFEHAIVTTDGSYYSYYCSGKLAEMAKNN